eukprot:TRINITY_DN10798_c0_g6_i1.p1 TRINITY_DN10798_c0_g6~~TRINITY_DN10798_c0_g6_i1.p1  ORF type:complete len:642 (-),score=168.52 TRINITY_DN10798_c0_g6_i1:187-2112(-)
MEKTNSHDALICSSHEGSQFFYCSTCKVMLCSNCLSPHQSEGHIIENAEEFATGHKGLVENYKKVLANDLAQKVILVNNYKVEMDKHVDKVFATFDQKVKAAFNAIRNEVMKRKSGLSSELNGILIFLKQQGNMDEFNDELNAIDKILKEKEEATLVLLKKDETSKKFDSKKQVIERAKDLVGAIEDKIRNYINGCKEIVETLEICNFSSIAGLKKEYDAQINKIRSSDARLREVATQLHNQIKYYSQVEIEIKALNEEKNLLKEKSKELDIKCKRLDLHLSTTKKNIEEGKGILERLEANIIEKKSELQYLASTQEERKGQLENLTIKIQNLHRTSPGVEMPFKEFASLSQASILYINVHKDTVFHVYHLGLKRSTSFELGKFGVSENCAFVQFKSDLYVSGGLDLLSAVFSANLIKATFNSMEDISLAGKAQMLLPKASHRMILVNYRHIYCIGGKTKEKKFINTCERYDVEDDRWEPAPTLNEAKLNVGVTAVDGVKVFVFGGYKGSYTSAVEMLNTALPKPKWVVVKLAGAKGWTGREEVGCVQVSEEKVLVFGGRKNTAGCNDNVFLFDLARNRFDMQEWKLSKKDWFDSGAVIRFQEDMICTPGLFRGDIHIFFSKRVAWGTVDVELWNKCTQPS